MKMRVLIGWMQDIEDAGLVVLADKLAEQYNPKEGPITSFEGEADTESECMHQIFYDLFHENWTAYDSISIVQMWNETTEKWE